MMECGVGLNSLVQVRYHHLFITYTIAVAFVSPPVVTCPTLTNRNGAVNVPSNNFGSTATYTCNTGYTINGDTTRMCQADGTWSGSEPTCQRESIQCGYNESNIITIILLQ